MSQTGFVGGIPIRALLGGQQWLPDSCLRARLRAHKPRRRALLPGTSCGRPGPRGQTLARTGRAGVVSGVGPRRPSQTGARRGPG